MSSLTLDTEDVVINLQEDNSFTLNCTYYNNSVREILNRKIIWKKQINGTFEDLAIFSPPGGPQPYISNKMKNLYENRTQLIGPNTSLSAVLIIKDPVCSDEATYKCWIEYYHENNSRDENFSFSEVVFNGMYILSK